jgi:hypothetical protein
MAYYAFLDENNIVVEVIPGVDEDTDGVDWEEKYGNYRGLTCKRTSFNTYLGEHYTEDSENPDVKVLSEDQSKAFRANYAGIGYEYNEEYDIFIEPIIDETYNSWVLNTDKGIYEPPIPYPDDGLFYNWDEDTESWVERT